MRRRSARNADAAIKGTGKKSAGKTSDVHECNWVEGRKTDTCSEVCPSPKELFEHVSQEHVSRGPKGFFCKWSGCGKRRKVVYVTLDSLQKHLKTHIYDETDRGDTLEDLDDELNGKNDEKNEHNKSDEEEEGEEEEDEEEEDEEEEDEDEDEDEEEEEEEQYSSKSEGASKKRKPTSTIKGKAKVQKVDTAAKNKNSASSDKSKPSAAAFDPSGFFYRFMCEWNVDASLYGMDTSISRYVKCKRKFKKYPEALDHLRNHHIQKLAAQDDPSFKCSWENCDSEEFPDADDLKEHVMVHAKGE